MVVLVILSVFFPPKSMALSVLLQALYALLRATASGLALEVRDVGVSGRITRTAVTPT